MVVAEQSSRKAPSGRPLPYHFSRRTKLALVAEIACVYMRVRLLTRRGTPLPTTLNDLRRPLDANGDRAYDLRDHEYAARLGSAVGRTLRVLPADSRCLSRSLVLTELLARRGIESSLIVGVSPGESFGAHAWVEYYGWPLLPAEQGEFDRLAEL